MYVWTHANEAKPPPMSPLEYGWRNENKYLMPKYFEGPMTFDFLQALPFGSYRSATNSLPASTHVSTSELARFVKVWYFVFFYFK
jgi:hypothetical protein